MQMYRREHYLAKLRPFYDDAGLIKVVTGIRRCGKSSLLCSVMDELWERGVAEGNICYINLDRREYQDVNTPESLMRSLNIAWASQLQCVTCLSTKYRT